MDEKTVRDLLRQAVALGANIAAITPNLIDDSVLSAARSVVENDTYWSLAWRVIGKLIDRLDDGGKLVVASDSDIAVLAQQAAIDPAMILVIIQTVMEIIKWWKNRK